MTWTNGATRTSTAAHKRWARAVLKQAHGRCEIADPGCTGVATHADHRVAVADGGSEFDVANGQGACKPCHDAKTLAETTRGRQRFYSAAKRPRRLHPTSL